MRALRVAFPNGIRTQRVDAELLGIVVKAGFTYVLYAPESGSATILKPMWKGLKPEIITPAIRMVKAAGLMVMSFWSRATRARPVRAGT